MPLPKIDRDLEKINPENIRGALIFLQITLIRAKIDYENEEEHGFTNDNIEGEISAIHPDDEQERNSLRETIFTKRKAITNLINNYDKLILDTLINIAYEQRRDVFTPNQIRELIKRLKKMNEYSELIRKVYLEITLLLMYDVDYESIEDYEIAMEKKKLIKSTKAGENRIKDILKTLVSVKNI